MSNEPGLTLGRLVAAERNAVSALAEVKRVSAIAASLSDDLAKAKAEVVQLKGMLDVLNARTATLMGSGATQRG